MKINNKIFAILSVIILSSFFTSCNKDEVNDDYLLVIPEVKNFNGPTVVFIEETHTYSVTPLRGGSEYIWTVEGAESSPVEGRPDLLNVTFNQIDNLAKVSVKEKAANGKESEVSFKDVKVFGTPCDWTLEMQDAYGDGWNGASVTLTFDGYPAGDFTIENGAASTVTIAVPNNSHLVATYNTGDWDEEVTYQLINASGVEVFTDGTNPTIGVAFEYDNVCP